MTFEWSGKARYIQSLYLPWVVGDGYSETLLADTETTLEFPLPALLHNFYHSWGQHNDMTRRTDALLRPEDLFIHADHLVFCAENQATYYWAIARDVCSETNPAVDIAIVNWQRDSDMPMIDKWEPCFPHLSDFLDEFTLRNAFTGGAIHGGSSYQMPIEQEQSERLNTSWNTVIVTPMFYGVLKNASIDVPQLYLRDGQAMYWWSRYYAVARSSIDLEQIAAEFHLTWEAQW